MDLSVIIPIYNHENYIEQCLNTILKDFPENAEIIIIDDASTDTSIEKIEKICSEKIKIYRNEINMGCAYSLNKGIELAKGNYIGINYSDDFVEIGFYKKMLEAAKKRDADIVCANIADYNDKEQQSLYNDITDGNIFYEEYKQNIELMENPFQVPAGFLLGHWTASSASTKIIKKQFYEKYKFSGSKANDIPSIYPIMAAANKIIYYPNLYLFYREVKNSLSRKDDEESYNSVVYSMIEAFKLLDEINAIEEKELLFFNNCLCYFIFTLNNIENEILKIKCMENFYRQIKEYQSTIFEDMQKSKYYQRFISKNINAEIYHKIIDGKIKEFVYSLKILKMKENIKSLEQQNHTNK